MRDGDYEGVVIDVEDRDASSCAISVAISIGEHRGNVVTIVGALDEAAALSMLGSPVTLRVVAGVPQLVPEVDT